MFWLGLVLTIVGGMGLLKFGLFGLLSGSGAIAGLLAPGRIDPEVRAKNVQFLKAMGAKALTGAVAMGVGIAILYFA